ncbi:MAG: SH3 domain-containing protein [Clostridia bacterium]|nr:SH3 domain-containing protein [Clostridia bacterium]
MKRSGNGLLRILSLFLSLLLLLTSFTPIALAEGETKTGYVTGSTVNVRSGPGTTHPSVAKLSEGHSVTILGEFPDSAGGATPWYQVSFVLDGASYTGYMRSDFVRVVPNLPPVEIPDFETQLAAFPEDYKAAVTALHQMHPTWNFIAYDTGLDWAEVQKLENRLGWSYINDGVISHYSTAPGSYDWETDQYFVKEGSNWYQAHPDVVAYFMDPRNFLNETDLFQFELLTFSPAAQTEEAIAVMLQGTFMEGKTLQNTGGEWISYARAFLDAANAGNVSAFHLVSRCIQELGKGGSSCGHGTYPGYEGYYNFFNIGANKGAKDGMIYARNKGWNSPYKAILGGGSFIGSQYIARGQNTPYYQKYNVVEKDNVAGHQYMTNVVAARSEGRIQKNKYTDLSMLESGHTFSIPVYKNMPETPCALPPAGGSPNNYLKDLRIEGFSLTPTFDFYDSLNSGRTNYTLKIFGNLPSIQVNATAVSKTATLSGNLGNIPIYTGDNTITVTCTAANGAVRNYTVTVTLVGAGTPGDPSAPPSAPDQPPPSTPSGWNPVYTIQGSVLTGITPGLTTQAFLSSLGVYGNAYAAVTDENGGEVSGAMRTGQYLHYFDGTSTVQYQIVIYGDVNGDSAIDAIDLLLIRKNLLGLVSLSDAFYKASDVNRDGTVDAIDLLLVRKALLGLTAIEP